MYIHVFQLTLTTSALDWIMKSLQENNMASKGPKPTMPDVEKEKKEGNIYIGVLRIFHNY